MTSIFQAGQPFNLVRTSSTTYQASDKDLVISSGDTVELPTPDQGATVLVRPAPSIDSVKITTSNGTIGNTGETYGYYRATEPLYLVGDGTNWYARSGSDEISAIPDSVVDNFEEQSNGGVYGQLSDFYTGNISDFDRNTNSPVAEGNDSLKVTGSSNRYKITSADGGGLNYYPEAGDTVRFNVYWSGGGSWPFVDMRFGVNGSSFYECSLNRANQWVRIYKDDSGTLLAEDTSPGLPDSEILEAEFDWGSGGSLTLTVFDSADNQISQVSASDSDYTDGGIGISMGQDGQTVMLDNIRTV